MLYRRAPQWSPKGLVCFRGSHCSVTSMETLCVRQQASHSGRGFFCQEGSTFFAHFGGSGPRRHSVLQPRLEHRGGNYLTQWFFHVWAAEK